LHDLFPLATPLAPILIISGTNRPGSMTLRVARAVREHYQTAMIAAELLDLQDLPAEVFAPTVYADKPAALKAMQRRVLDAAGLHVVTPEYNGSFPGILKYFIDLLKFPESFERKPVAFVGVAAGSFGALRPVEQLQMIFAYRNAHLYPERVFIAGAGTKIDAQGKVIDAELDRRLTQQARGFAHFAAAVSTTILPAT
jgi:NAD(P)H-dependent FMN reductase